MPAAKPPARPSYIRDHANIHDICIYAKHTHTHTGTYIYIRIHIYGAAGSSRDEGSIFTRRILCRSITLAEYTWYRDVNRGIYRGRACVYGIRIAGLFAWTRNTARLRDRWSIRDIHDGCLDTSVRHTYMYVSLRGRKSSTCNKATFVLDCHVVLLLDTVYVVLSVFFMTSSGRL